jgi:hypothetical protein
MNYCLPLKGKFISLLTDGAKRGDKNFYVVVAYSAQKLYFIDLLNLESSDHVSVAQHVALIIQALSTYSICVNCIVTDNARNLVRALSPDELTETVQILPGEKASNVRCDCHSADLALDDISSEVPSPTFGTPSIQTTFSMQPYTLHFLQQSVVHSWSQKPMTIRPSFPPLAPMGRLSFLS